MDKRQRNRCQSCRYQKCLKQGMKREAVQEERQRVKEQEPEDGNENRSLVNKEMPVEDIRQAELNLDNDNPSTFANFRPEIFNYLVQPDCSVLVKYLTVWATQIPHFMDIDYEDQICLLKDGWNELMLADFAHRSIHTENELVLSKALIIDRNNSPSAGLGYVFERVLTEVVAKMRDMRLDKTELGCLRAIILFNPDAKGVTQRALVDSQREKVYASLEEYVKLQYPDEMGRFARLLLRLPALRSIGLKFSEPVLAYCLGGASLDALLRDVVAGVLTRPINS